MPAARDPQRVPWEEAREVLTLVLLLAALAYLIGPLVRHLSVDSQLDWWGDLRVILSNINVVSGLLLVGAALTVCTTPPDDVVPNLRRAVKSTAGAVTGLGLVEMVAVLTAGSGTDPVFLRIAAVMVASGPGTLLAGLAAWLVDRVDMFTAPD